MFFRCLAASSSFTRVTLKTKRITIPILELELELELKTTNATERTLSFMIIFSCDFISHDTSDYFSPSTCLGTQHTEFPWISFHPHRFYQHTHTFHSLVNPLHMTLEVEHDKEFKRTYTNPIDNINEKTPEKHQCDDCGQGMNSHMRLMNHNQQKRMNLNLPDLINSKILVILMIPLILLNRILKKKYGRNKKL